MGHPGLGERLEELVGDLRAQEAGATDNPIGVGALKAVLSYVLLLLINLVWRPDGSNGLDYDSAERTSDEEWVARRTVDCLGQLLNLLHGVPVRTGATVEGLEECLEALREGDEETWEPELVRLGDEVGLAIERQRISGGVVSFATPEGAVTAYAYKARNPDVALDGAWVYLVRWLPEKAAEFGGPGEDAARYAVMVDDPYWGRRVQPAEFAEAPLTETFVMGYRVKGRILQDGEAVEGAAVSLEGETWDRTGVGSSFWDSLEYNELVWSDTLETWVEGPQVFAPIMTDAEGRWSFICPKGHGAIYQRATDRRDGSAETAAEALPRTVTKLSAVHRGRRVELHEDEEAVIDLQSGVLEVSGDPGSFVNVGTLDEDGQSYVIGESGTVTVTGLPAGEHGVVQFRRNAWGEWEASYGCARQVAEVVEGGTASVAMGAMEWYDPAAGVIAGRVYEHMGKAAAGVAIVTLNYETGEFGEAIATTDGGGYWEVEIPPEGLSGDPWIHDAQWGSMPVLGFPYSDVVLGARAYAAPIELYKPEIWRKGDRGHANFQYLQDGVWVEEAQGSGRWDTEEAAYGGWVTKEPLPKYRYVESALELLLGGPQLREYSLQSEGGVLQASFYLRSQAFSEYEDLPGQFRAAGYYPEAKFLLGGKVAGSVVCGKDKAIGVSLPEAARLGLEFGEAEWYVQVRQERGTEAVGSSWSDLVCPYCGGPTWRDPDGEFLRGFCIQCAMAFERVDAMDGRTHFTSRGLAASEERYALRATRVRRRGGAEENLLRRHWRPDVYDETEDYLTQAGLGQVTNAPRWVARHVDELADGKGFGHFDLDGAPQFVTGHSLEYFGQLPEVDRDLGLAQVKLRFAPGYVQEAAAVVAVRAKRADGSEETVEVFIPAGTRGPSEDDPVGDVVPVTPVDKEVAETRESPYEGAGLFSEVTAVEVVQAPATGGCEFAVINDGPLLASAAGVPVEDRRQTPVALQLGRAWSGPHLLDDGVGQVFLVCARDGEICLTRRAGLPGDWETLRPVTSGGDNRHPVAEKDGRGRLLLVWDTSGRLEEAVSRDDGGSWG